MTLANNFEAYKNEIELIKVQNPVEIELYSIIASIFRERKNGTNISLRDVSARQPSKKSKSFMSESGFPDFVILSKNFRMVEPDEGKFEGQILGAIEAKSILEKSLDFRKDSKLLKQFNDHIEKFKKVIYTNGLEWRFYQYDESEKEEKLEWQVKLGEWNKNEIKWDAIENNAWNDLLDKLEKIVWI